MIKIYFPNEAQSYLPCYNRLQWYLQFVPTNEHESATRFLRIIFNELMCFNGEIIEFHGKIFLPQQFRRLVSQAFNEKDNNRQCQFEVVKDALNVAMRAQKIGNMYEI